MAVSKKRTKKTKSKSKNPRTLLRNRTRKTALSLFEGFNIATGNAKHISAILKEKQEVSVLSARHIEIGKMAIEITDRCTEMLEDADKELDELRQLTKSEMPVGEWMDTYGLRAEDVLVKWEGKLTDLAIDIQDSLFMLEELSR